MIGPQRAFVEEHGPDARCSAAVGAELVCILGQAETPLRDPLRVSPEQQQLC